MLGQSKHALIEGRGTRLIRDQWAPPGQGFAVPGRNRPESVGADGSDLYELMKIHLNFEVDLSLEYYAESMILLSLYLVQSLLKLPFLT
jgi:hypothetical protein